MNSALETLRRDFGGDIMAVQRRPDLFSAFVSTGLIANFAEGQQVAYRFLLAESRRRGNTKAFTELSSLASPPYGGTEGIAKWRRCARWLSEFGALWHSRVSRRPGIGLLPT
jgi:hypothetical protein